MGYRRSVSTSTVPSPVVARLVAGCRSPPGRRHMDAVKLIKEDHRMVERLFKKFRQAGPRAYRTKEGLARRITRELSVHASIEEQLLYPALRNAEGNGEVEEALHEHQEVKEALAQLETMSPEDPRFDETMNRVIEDVTHHAKEEERDMLPKLRNALTRKDLNELGDRMKTAKKMAPTRPHPSAPNTPPGNLIAGPAAAIADRARDIGKKK
jgi:hemerythrin superfamily protein